MPLSRHLKKKNLLKFQQSNLKQITLQARVLKSLVLPPSPSAVLSLFLGAPSWSRPDFSLTPARVHTHPLRAAQPFWSSKLLSKVLQCRGGLFGERHLPVTETGGGSWSGT